MHSLTHYQKDYSFTWLEQRLRSIGFRLVYCTRSPETFAAAREERLKVSGNPSQYDDLDQFVREQALMRRLVSESMLPVLEVDVSDNNIPAAVEKIADWLEVSSGLSSDY